MLIVIVIFLILSLIANFITISFTIRFVKRSFQFDDMFGIVIDEVDSNIVYLDEVLQQSLLSNAPVVVEFDRRLRQMRDRFVTISMAISESKKPIEYEKFKQANR